MKSTFLKMLALFGITTALVAGCRTVPVLDSDGQPTGETREEFDQETAEGAATAVAPFLPYPLNIILAGAAGIAATIRTQREGESK